MKATKKPIEIEYYPVEYKYIDKIMEWSTSKYQIVMTGDEREKKIIKLGVCTLEGVMVATEKDVIIKGINGEVYPCKKDIFEKTYVKSEDN